MKDHDERLWRREGHEEGWRSRCAYLWWEWRLIWLMQMNVAGVYRWISNETTPPPVRSDHHQSDIIKDTLTEQNTRPEKHLFSTQPAVPHIRQRKHTHTHTQTFFPSRGMNYYSDTRSEKHSSPWGWSISIARVLNQTRGGITSVEVAVGEEATSTGIITFFNQRDHLTKIIRRTEAAKAKHTWRVSK